MTFSWRMALGVAVGLVAAQVLVLYLLGQPWLCSCGYVKLWEGMIFSVGNSQHISDWYTFSHIIHGFVFYAVLTYFFPRVPMLWRLALALGLEVGWEIMENTPWVINQYREQALAAGYTGDSILNSLSDTLAMLAGFLLAWRLPVWLTVAFAIGMELFVGYAVHDNLALNILNFIYQFDAIVRWQSGA